MVPVGFTLKNIGSFSPERETFAFISKKIVTNSRKDSKKKITQSKLVNLTISLHF
jgi:hypothetical protein